MTDQANTPPADGRVCDCLDGAIDMADPPEVTTLLLCATAHAAMSLQTASDTYAALCPERMAWEGAWISADSAAAWAQIAWEDAWRALSGHLPAEIRNEIMGVTTEEGADTADTSWADAWRARAQERSAGRRNYARSARRPGTSK